MIFLECFGKNVYIDDELAGYISPETGDMYSEGHKFGSLTEYGDIYIQGEYVGYIEDNGDIYIREQRSGYVGPTGDLYLDSLALASKENY